MENCADMDAYQSWAWNDLNCETAQANVLFMVFTVQIYGWAVSVNLSHVSLCRVLCAKCPPV